MELRHLRYFTAVVQWKGYREASRRLHIAQAAISRTVADLEDELGLKLFSRQNTAEAAGWQAMCQSHVEQRSPRVAITTARIQRRAITDSGPHWIHYLKYWTGSFGGRGAIADIKAALWVPPLWDLGKTLTLFGIAVQVRGFRPVSETTEVSRLCRYENRQLGN